MARRWQQDRGKERFWRRMVGQWRRSGQTVRDFCAAHALSEPSFFASRPANHTFPGRSYLPGRGRGEGGT